MILHPSFDEVEKALIDELIVCATAFLLARGRSVVIDGFENDCQRWRFARGGGPGGAAVLRGKSSS
jgi:hypothetical protein